MKNNTWFKKIIDRLFRKDKWLKIENKSEMDWSWTEYTDYEGRVYIIYNLIQEPGFFDAKLEIVS